MKMGKGEKSPPHKANAMVRKAEALGRSIGYLPLLEETEANDRFGLSGPRLRQMLTNLRAGLLEPPAGAS